MPQPDLIGEFGRYTVASHMVYLLEIGSVKHGQPTPGAAEIEPWYLLNGSLMVSLPDALIVEGQQFVVLPLDRWETPAQGVRLGGRRTCDSDDFYPRPSQPPLMLPEEGQGLVVAVFGVGAYQQMISGRGGAHHCLNPEMRRIIIEQDGDALVVREVAPQNLGTIMSLLGYNTEALEPVTRAQPAQVDRKPAREMARVLRAPRRRQFVPRPRALAHARRADRGWGCKSPGYMAILKASTVTSTPCLLIRKRLHIRGGLRGRCNFPTGTLACERRSATWPPTACRKRDLGRALRPPNLPLAGDRHLSCALTCATIHDHCPNIVPERVNLHARRPDQRARRARAQPEEHRCRYSAR